MNLEDPRQREAWRRHLGELLRGRKVICAIAPLAGWTSTVDLLAQAGAHRPLLVANGLGAGPAPDPDAAEVVFVDVPASESMTEDLRRVDHVVRHLPPYVVEAVEAYDPDGDAVWRVQPFVGSAPVLGRPVLGGRPEAWTALEDKLVADELWDAIGAPRPDSRIVRVRADELRAASRDLDAGAGVVWAGDARDGFNGGGDFVRWVATEADAESAHAFFAPRCDRVRVTPFLAGVPCGVHGIVLPDGTAPFRPVELAILRGPGRRFVYGGRGTTWDPPPADCEAMRDLVRRTGEELRSRVGYRGAFGIDGVLTIDGFRPTELNPRMSGGLASMARVVHAGLFELLQLNVLAGRDPGVGVADLEGWAVPRMDAARFVKALAISPLRVGDEPRDVPVSWDGTRLRRSPVATGWSVAVGPNPAGTYVALGTPEPPPDGLRAANLNVALMRFVDAELGTGFGDVCAAPDVRSRGGLGWGARGGGGWAGGA